MAGYSYGTNMDKFYEDNKKSIEGIAKANNVDMSVATAMFSSNIAQGSNYKGGGVVNMNNLKNAYNAALSADKKLNAGNSYGGGTGNRYLNVGGSSTTETITPPSLSYNLLGKEYVDQWKNEYINSMLASIAQGYNTNVLNTNKQYDNLVGDYRNQINDVNYRYANDVNTANQEAYANQRRAVEGASRLGLSNSGLGAAMTNSLLVNNALNRIAMENNKNNSIDNLQNAITVAEGDRANTLNTLSANKSAAEMQANAEAREKYLSAVNDIERYNTDIKNQTTQAAINRAHDEHMAKLQNDLAAGREADMARLQAELSYNNDANLARLQAELNKSLTPYKGETEPKNLTKPEDIALWFMEHRTDGFTDAQMAELNAIMQGIPLGLYSLDDFKKKRDEIEYSIKANEAVLQPNSKITYGDDVLSVLPLANGLPFNNNIRGGYGGNLNTTNNSTNTRRDR